MSVLGHDHVRVDGRDKVTGVARYAVEKRPDDALHAWAVRATVPRGRVVSVDAESALAVPGVVEVLTWRNAPRLQDAGDDELQVLQDDRVAYRGQVVALVVAETLEVARETAATLDVRYETEPHDVGLTIDHPGLYAPEQANAGADTDSARGDVEEGLASSAHVVEAVYETPALFNNPMEPHATVAWWEDGALRMVDSTQGTTPTAQTMATLFGLDEPQVRVTAEHVGGGFGSKGEPKANPVLAALAAKAVGRPVALAWTRQMMFGLAGYRTPTISRVRLGADADGRLEAISHEAFSQTSRLKEFTEQTAEYVRHMYGSRTALTTHRVTQLDVHTPSWMRAPGECPGAYAIESALDELAHAAGVDPVELRRRNEPEVDPETGAPYSSRQLMECHDRAAELFGWAGRDPRPGVRRDGHWLVGTGVASSSYPAMAAPSGARVTARPDGTFRVGVNATDIGTGARTVMLQVAAEELKVEPERVHVHIADSDLPHGAVAGGSSGSASWGWAVAKACRALRSRMATERVPDDGLEVVVDTSDDLQGRPQLARFAYGAQMVEARVDVRTGEVVVPRSVGVFAAGRILNPRTARSQLLGGMTMGLSMALHEEGLLDERFGGWANHDLATYHVAANADVGDVTIEWLPEDDGELGPLKAKGIGEIGIVGAAAAVANAVWHATGVRVRSLPIQPDKLLDRLPG